MVKRIKIRVKGRVQGVFFRAKAKEKAEKMGLLGYVKNEPDGSVLIVAEGEEEKLDEMVEFANEGPDHARVSKVEVDILKAKGGFEGFEIKGG